MSIPFRKASTGQCAWIVSAAPSPPAFKRQKVEPGPRVCGVPVVYGSSYCPCHKAASIRSDQKPFRLAPQPRSRRVDDDERTQDLTEIFK